MTEALFHLVWAERLFRSESLHTTEGDPLRIEKSGILHQGDGPDFRNATILLNRLRFEGDIELHVRCRDWYHHRHHQDPSYNNVILHVVLMADHATAVQRCDGTFCPTLVLFPNVTARITELAKSSAFRGKLACHGQIGNVPEPIIDAQFRDAEARYFDQKQNDVLSLLDPTLPRSEGWRRMLRKACFDALGIRFNRDAMRQLHDSATNLHQLFVTADEAGLVLSEIAFGRLTSPRWDSSGSRPDNQPRTRVAQAAQIWYNLQSAEPDTLTFAQLIHDTRLGAERKNVLFKNVWLPCRHLWAQWTNNPSARHQALEQWSARTLAVPLAVANPFIVAGFPESIVGKSSGTAWQLRERCRRSGCQECGIMRTLIRS